MSEQILEVKTATQLAFYIRGEVLTHFIMMENLINVIIAYDICNSKSGLNDAVTVVFDLNFHSKIKALESILSKMDKLTFLYKDLIKDINVKINIRNDFAHCITDSPEDQTVHPDFEIKLTKVNKLAEVDSHRIVRIYKKSEHMTVVGEIHGISGKLMEIIQRQEAFAKA